jgi:hypothetical protein
VLKKLPALQLRQDSIAIEGHRLCAFIAVFDRLKIATARLSAVFNPNVLGMQNKVWISIDTGVFADNEKFRSISLFSGKHHGTGRNKTRTGRGER